MSSLTRKKGSSITTATLSSTTTVASSSSTTSSTLTNDKDSILNLERSLRTLLLKDTKSINSNGDQNSNNKGDINSVLELALEAINKQQWRRIDELNFIDAAENNFPDLNVYRSVINNEKDDNKNMNNNANNDDNETLDAVLNQYNRIILKMNELKHLDKSRVKNLYAISKLLDDINTKKGKSYTLKNVLNISVKSNNIEKFHNNTKLGKDKKNNIKSDSNKNLTNLEMQIEALNDAEYKAIQSRKNEHKFWNILDKHLNKYDDILKSSSSTSSSQSMKELEYSISTYIDMMSKLEQAVQSFMTSGLSYENMQKISNKVNTEIYSEMFEKMTKEQDDDGYDNNYRENILARNHYINIDRDSIMYRFLQSQWKVPLRPVKPALETLRSRHKDMLIKIAKASQPYSPYEFVFK